MIGRDIIFRGEREYISRRNGERDSRAAKNRRSLTTGGNGTWLYLGRLGGAKRVDSGPWRALSTRPLGPWLELGTRSPLGTKQAPDHTWHEPLFIPSHSVIIIGHPQYISRSIAPFPR